MSQKDKFEKLTKMIKNKNFVIAVGVFVLLISSLGVTYASFLSVKTNTTNQSITTGTLNVSYNSSDTTGGVVDDNMQPKTDSEGLNQTDSKIISIQNTGTLDSRFYITFGYDMTNLKAKKGYSSSWVLTPLNYIRFAIYQINSATSETLVAGPMSLSELPIYTYSSTSNNNRYLAYFNTVGGTSSGDSTKNYRIKTWLSIQADPSVAYTYFYVDSQVVAEVADAHLGYNVSGTIKDSSGTSLSDAVISIQNGSLTSTSSDGSYTIKGLYPGTYNVDITYKDNTYKGNLTVEEGSSVALTSYGTTFSGSDIYTVANTYKTTIDKIMTKNSLTGNTNDVTVSSGSLYPTYKLVGAYDTEITGVDFTLDTTSIMYTMAKS